MCEIDTYYVNDRISSLKKKEDFDIIFKIERKYIYIYILRGNLGAKHVNAIHIVTRNNYDGLFIRMHSYTCIRIHIDAHMYTSVVCVYA